MSSQSPYFSPLTPFETNRPELVEKNKAIKFKGVAKTIAELGKASTISNSRLPVVLQSLAFLGDY